MGFIGFRAWTWLAVYSAIGICGALTWYSVAQHRIVTRTTELVGSFRSARVDLAQGFLQISLAGGSDASFDRAQGRALINQALADLRQAARAGAVDQAIEAGEAPMVDETLASIDAFAAELDRLDSAAPPAEIIARLRIAYSGLESRLDQLDQINQRDLQQLEERFQWNFSVTLIVGVILLGTVGTGMHLAGRAHQRSLAELRATEDRLNTLVNSLAEGVMLTDSSGTVRWNEAARIIHGIQGQESLPTRRDEYRNVFEVTNLDGTVLAYEHWPMSRALRGEGMRNLELRVRRLDRSWERVLCFAGAKVEDSKGDELAFLSFTDITESKHASDRLRLFRALLDHTRDGIEVIEPDTGRFLDINESTCRELGYSRGELLAMSVSEIDPAMTPSAWAQYVEQVRKRGSVNGESRHRRKDGTEFPIEFTAAWVRPDREYLVAVVRNVTERVQAQQALRDSEARHRALVEQSLAGIYVVEGRRFLYVSPGFAGIFGYDSPDDIVGKVDVPDLVAPADKERVVENIRRRVSGEIEDLHYEFKALRRDGSTIDVEVQGRMLEYEGQRAVMGVLLDVSQRKHLEEQFRQAQKMEAIGTLAGGIAHDFNNILAAILGFAGVARMEAEGDSAMTEIIDGILEASRRATDLVRQILAFSRMQVQEQQVVQLRHIVVEATKLLRATVPTSIEFDSSLATNAPPVLADPSQVHQVIMNLGTNAVHAMKDRGGRLGFVLEPIDVGPDFAVRHLALRPGPYNRLSITDTGHGMDAAVLGRIFEPFFTTKDPGEGTGLGLAVVHGIMKSHHGAVSVYSQPGEGTRFDLYFPVHMAEEPAPTPGGEDPAAGFGECIMLVDDEEPLVRMGRRVLDRLGYEVETFRDPDAAWQAFQRTPGKYDLVITDLTMPGLSGTELAERLLQLRPHTPIVLVTGFSANMTLEKAREIGIRELLLKPFSVQDLGEAVRRALAQKE